jgi:ResB-like family
MVIKRLFKLLSSLQLTVALLLLGLILVFLGTMAQEPLGLYIAQTRFFHSFFVDWASILAAIKKSLQLVGIYVAPMQAQEVLQAPWIPAFPGGYLIGGVLLANLLAAHAQRFKFSWKKSGILLTHAGLILLLVGQVFTDKLGTESGMRLTEGETKNYSEADRSSELAIIDVTDSEKDKVVAIPESLMTAEGPLQHEALPFTIRVKKWYEHSSLTNRVGAMTNQPAVASQGVGARLQVTARPKVTAMEYRDVPSAIIEVLTGAGSMGTWLVSGYLDRPQRFTYKDRIYELSLRLKRLYYPFSLTLLDFSHDKYRGTDIPRNFSSKVRLQNSSRSEDREVKIYMNNPLRYQGRTFYQASFDKVDERVTILQVVQNPGWVTPYVACALVGGGLVVQFLIHLVGFIRKRKV